MTLPRPFWIAAFAALCLPLAGCATQAPAGAGFARWAPDEAVLFPVAAAANVNPDTPIKLTFQQQPQIGEAGLIRIYDAADGTLVDTLDIAIPASPRPTGRTPNNPTGATQSPTPPQPPGPDTKDFQATQIGGTWFHFFPVTVRGNTAMIQPHHGRLKYGKTYRVKLDAGVLKLATNALVPETEWTFTTKPAPPAAGLDRYTVAADGSGDFTTVQGAIDFVPNASAKRTTIFIRNGNYEEIVYARDKTNLVIRGESRDGVVVGYRNNSAFNRVRYAFALMNVKDVQLSTFTINNYFIGQAEALMSRGDRVVIDRMTLNGSGDGLQTAGSMYMVDSSLYADGDSILAYATLFCLRCEIRSIGPLVWPRNPKGQHGNIFVDSTLIALDKPSPWSVTPLNPKGTKPSNVFARLPLNGPDKTNPASNFPYGEMVVINSKTDNIKPEGWILQEETPAFPWANVHLWEFNTMDLAGKLVDTSKRIAGSKVLDAVKDAETIRNYQNPEWVLGWKPVVVN